MLNSTLWECYGHGHTGVAVVLAAGRAAAIQACREWLGWTVIVAFRAPERLAVFQNCGGRPDAPVVFASDGVHFARVERSKQ